MIAKVIGGAALSAGPLAVAATVAGVVNAEIGFRSEQARLPLTSDTNILPHEVFPGPTADAPALFFLHGYPDDLTMFRAYAKQLSKTYHCVNCTFPNNPLPDDFDGNAGTVPERKYGFTFQETVDALNATIQLACAGHMDKVGVTLMLHDWGSVFGHAVVLQQKVKVHRVISLDVGGRPGGATVPFVLSFALYQGLIILCWLLPVAWGDYVANMLFLAVIQVLCGGKRPLPPGQTKHCKVTQHMNWPYYAVWKDFFTYGGSRQAAVYAPAQGMPSLFLHSNDFPAACQFFDSKFIEAVEQSSPQSRTMQFAGSHWFFIQDHDRVLAIIEAWLEETK